MSPALRAWAVVKITDRGRGFDPAATPPSRRGIRESITGRMLAVGKDALLARAIEDGVIKPGEISPYKSFARAAADRPSLGAPGP